MADENTRLGIDVDVDGMQKLQRLKQQLKSVGREARKLSASSATIASNYFSQQKRLMNSSTGVWKRHFDQVDQMVKMFGKGLMKFVSFSAKFASIQVGALGAALMAVHAAFVVGQFAAKAYHAVMKVVSGGLASITIAATVAAAAMREQQAAMYAYRGTNMSEFGRGINQINTQMRMMQSDAQLATVGAEGLNAALAEIYKTGTYGGGQQRMLKALMDFGAAGQDIKTGAAAAGKLIAALNDPKATFSSIKEAAKALGPSMEQALTKLNITTKEGLQAAILDGTLAAAGGVQGQFEAVSTTLISQFKGSFTQIKSFAADFGQSFLKPTKETFQEIVHIFRRGFVRVVPELTAFGNGSLFEGLISGMEKLEDLFVKIMREYLPATQGMFDRLGEWWDRFMLGWNKMVESLRPMIDGSRVLLDMFKALGHELQGQGDVFSHTNKLIIENSDDVVEFGSRVGKLLNVLAEYGRTLREMFFDVLPFINKILDGITLLADSIFSLMGAFRGLFGGGGFGSLFMIMSLLGGGKSMSKNVGGFIKQRELIPNQMTTQNMTVSAGSVTLTGATAQGQTNPNAGRGMAGTPPGYTPPGGGRGGGGSYGGAGGVIMPPGTPGTGMYGLPIAGSKSTTAGGMSQSPVAAMAKERAAIRNSLMEQGYTRAQATSMANGMVGYTPGGSKSSTDPAHPAAQRRMSGFGRLMQGKMRYEGDTASFLRTFNAAKEDPMFQARTLRESQMKYQNLVFDDKGNMVMDPKTGLPMTQFQQGGKRQWKWKTDPSGLTQDINPGRMKTLAGNLFRQPRQSIGYKKLFGDYETGQKGRFTGGSMGMNIGASMGIGMLSNIAPKEMQGALALGSSLAAINPMLGLGVAGIGGGIASGNALAGAGMGALGGAALGMQMGGPVGAAVGALGGALIGGFGAWWNKNKRRKQEAKKAAEKIVGDTTAAFYEGFRERVADQGISAFTSQNIGRVMADVARPFEGFNRELDRLKGIYDASGSEAAKQYLQILFDDKSSEMSKYIKNQEQLDDLMGNIGTAINTMSEDQMINDRVREMATTRYTNVIQALSQSFNKSEEEILAMAKEKDIDLFNTRKGFNELFKEIGGALDRTQADLRANAADAQADIMDRIRQRQEQLKAPEAIDQAAAALYEKGQAGPLTEVDMTDFISTIMPLMTQYYGGDSLQALAALSQQIGAGGRGFKEGSYFSEILSPSVAAAFQGPEGSAILQMVTDEFNRLSGAGVSGGVNALLAEEFGLVGDTALLEQQGRLLAANDYARFDELIKFLDPTQNPELQNFSSADAFAQELFNRFGLEIGTTQQAVNEGGVASLSAENITATLGLTEDALGKVNTALDTFSSTLTNMLSVTDMSVAATNVNVSTIDGDTTTPRGDTPSSRFRSTYVNHSYFDSMLSGKRKVTSGLRNFNLGSINSDHVTGRALDLTGQNLGMYKTSVEAAGGFAEFHGSNGSRHLHVVPPNGPSGDASTPVAASANNNPATASATPGAGPGQYVININGYNKNPQQLANEVIAIMRASERSMSERRGK